MRNNKTTLIMVIFFFMGLLVLFYPALSNYTNEKLQSKAINDYEKIISKIEVKDYTDIFTKADEYNQKLGRLNKPLISYPKLGDYKNIINVNGKGMMGYITINKIKVELPIYAGTDGSILDKAVGQLEGSSLPVGGLSVHSVLSAHRGLPSSKLFTDLDKLEIGDTFVVKVLDRTMTYEIDQIIIVEPSNTDDLNIVEGEDYVTLMTCTPYGINTHRMLVRGHRVENAKVKAYVSTQAFKINRLVVTPLVCMPIVLIWFMYLMFKPIERKVDYKLKYVYPTEYKEQKAKKKLKRLKEAEKLKNKKRGNK